MNLFQQQGECSADIPVCRCANFPVGEVLVARQTLELSPRFAGWKTCGTADKNVCATRVGASTNLSKFI
jgi:hypothetical protein